MPRMALGLSYNGGAYQGWQSQLSGLTVQDKLEAALQRFCGRPVSTLYHRLPIERKAEA